METSALDCSNLDIKKKWHLRECGSVIYWKQRFDCWVQISGCDHQGDGNPSRATKGHDVLPPTPQIYHPALAFCPTCSALLHRLTRAWHGNSVVCEAAVALKV